LISVKNLPPASGSLSMRVIRESRPNASSRCRGGAPVQVRGQATMHGSRSTFPVGLNAKETPMKSPNLSIVLFAALLPLGNAALSNGGGMSVTRFQYQQPTEAQRLALQQAQQRAATASAAGARGPVGTPGPGSGHGTSAGGPHR
jgi:hypothetical protein